MQRYKKHNKTQRLQDGEQNKDGDGQNLTDTIAINSKVKNCYRERLKELMLVKSVLTITYISRKWA